MKLKGAVVDRMREVLGGKTPTGKRVADLLAEVEHLRATQGAHVGQGTVSSGGHPPDVGSEDFNPPGDLETAAVESEAVEAPPVAADDRAILIATLKHLEAKVAELSKPREKEETEQAIGAGRLPIATAAPAPVGYTGSAELPRGTWFRSPFGPPIQMMLCGCAECSPFRLNHSFCVSCRRARLPRPQRRLQHRRGRPGWQRDGRRRAARSPAAARSGPRRPAPQDPRRWLKRLPWAV